MAEITIFEAGFCTHPACMVLKGAGVKSQCFPSRAYLISTKVGNFLWDTGYAEHFMDASHGVYRLYSMVTPVTFNPSQSLILQLKSNGVTAKDIRGIIVSHFHADHVAGLLDFSGTNIICSFDAWNSIKNIKGISALKKGHLPDLIPKDIETRLSFVEQLPNRVLPNVLRPFETGWDLTGCGDVLIVDLPGHAKGHLGAFIATEQGWVLLASDAAWTEEAYTSLRGPSELSFLIQNNRKEYYETLNQLHQLHIQNQVKIMLTHQS
jgi:glyoxylase-like metal-dependent hydrolase (beta-lactamase superfamily II)